MPPGGGRGTLPIQSRVPSQHEASVTEANGHSWPSVTQTRSSADQKSNRSKRQSAQENGWLSQVKRREGDGL